MNRAYRRRMLNQGRLFNNRKNTKGRKIFASHVAQMNGLNIVPGYSVVGIMTKPKKLGEEEKPEENQNII